MSDYDRLPEMTPTATNEHREMVYMLCRSMLMFVQWANKRYRLGFKI